MNTKQPLITVLTSYYNDEEFLADAIESVLSQTYTNFEYILLNHASTDRSRQIAHSFKDTRIKHIDLPINYGGSGNILIKKGLEQANGIYLKLLPADDILLPNCLEKLLKKAQEDQADLVFGDVCFVNKNKQPTGRTWFKNRYPANLSTPEYLRHFINGTSYFPYTGNFIKIDALKSVKMDCVSIQLADIGIWVNMLLNGAKLSFISDSVANYRIHDKQMCGSSKIQTMKMRCLFEHFLFCQNFFNAYPKLTLLKQVFPKNPFISKLEEEDRDLFTFAIAQAIYDLSPSYSAKLAARLKLAEILNNYRLQQSIEKKFGYTLKDFRKTILNKPFLVTKARNKTLKDASFSELSYYFFRKILHILSLKELRKNINKNERNKDGIL